MGGRFSKAIKKQIILRPINLSAVNS